MDLFSVEFLIFLIATFLLYYCCFLVNKLVKKTIIPQWSILLVASMVFYGFSNYIYLIYLGISFFVSYLTSFLVQHSFFKKDKETNKLLFKPTKVDSHLSRKKYENIITAIAILINVGILAVLKYFNFFIGSINTVFSMSLTTYRFIIPLGISFYTFSLISYNVDCCKRITSAEKNPFKFLLFVSYFPKILQGPISTYKKMEEDGLFCEHNFVDINYLKSFFRISVGLIKKIAIANVLNLYVNAAYSNVGQTYGWQLALVSIFYTIQLYCDFSGFADITIGISGLFGIKMEENFDIPYISSSIQEFWRRWHITLGAWLKKYIYIPLGGNRVPIWRWIINTMIVWLVSGIWHGANWTFIVWGLFHGTLLVIGGLPKLIEKKKGVVRKESKHNRVFTLLSIAITFVLVDIGWILFRSDNIKNAFEFMWNMIRFWLPSQYHLFSDSTISSANWLLIMSLCLLVLLIFVKAIVVDSYKLFPKLENKKYLRLTVKLSMTIVFFSIALFVFIYLNSLGGGESSFIYFDF